MKALKKISVIIFNVLLILAVFANVISFAAGEYEEVITEEIFGGYEKDTDYSADSVIFPSAYKSVAQVKNAANNVANAVESEGATLVKNQNDALPLSKGATVTLFSVSSILPVYAGGSGATINNIADSDKVYFPKALEEAGLKYNKKLYDWYVGKGSLYGRRNEVKNGPAYGNDIVATIDEAPWNDIPDDVKNVSAEAGIFVLSRVGTERVDLKDEYLSLDDNEKSVLKGMKTLKDNGTVKKIVVLVNSAQTVNMDFADNAEYGVDSILWIGLPGTSGLYGVCDLLAGLITPSGRLSDTWYINNAFNPARANYGDFNHEGSAAGKKEKYVVYQEGVYIGYRYAETRYEDKVLNRANTGDFNYNEIVKYPFGHGLSYTSFAYSDMTGPVYDEKSDEFTFSVTVKNTGKIKAKEVVQLYMQSPYTSYDIENNIEKPSVQLVGFAKTAKLEPGKTETVKISVAGRELAAYDAYKAKTYYLDKGDYYFTFATDSHAAINNILAKKGKTTADGMTEEGNADLAKVYTVAAASATKYSTVTVNGADTQITNLFDFGDINRLNDSVNSIKYYSRNDWAGTLPTVGADKKFSAAMHAVIKSSAKIVEQRSTDLGNAILKKDENGNDKVYKFDEVKNDPNKAYPTYNAKNGIVWQDMRMDDDGKFIAYDDPRWDKLLDQLSLDQTIKLLSSGLRHTEVLSATGESTFTYPGTTDPNGPNGIKAGSGNYANDGGFAKIRNDPDAGLATTAYPCAGILASTFNTDLAEVCGEAYGEEALWAGVNGIYAFTVNLHRYATHGRMAESYSEDPVLTGYICGYQSRGCQNKGLSVYTKHLVLNEQETNRKDHESWITEQALREVYLKAFEVAIKTGGGRNVMTSFAKIGGVWSGHNKNLLTNWLRGECGLTGFAVTDYYTKDYMSMKAAVLCGQDLPDGEIQSNHLEFVKEGNASEVAWAMREAAHRIFYSAVQSSRVNGLAKNVSVSVNIKTPAWVKVKNAVTISLDVLAVLSACFVVVGYLIPILKTK